MVGFFVLLKDVDSCLDSFCLFEEVFADFEEACLGVARNANKLPHSPPAICAIIAMLSFCWGVTISLPMYKIKIRINDNGI